MVPSERPRRAPGAVCLRSPARIAFGQLARPRQQVLQPAAMRAAVSLSMLLWLPTTLCAQSSSTWAAPIVTIRGEARLQLRQLTYLEGVATITGSLLDAATQEPLPNRRVSLRLEVASVRHRRVARTDPQGRFTVTLRTSEGVHLLAFDFAGDKLYAATRTPARMVDVSKPTIALRLSLPPRLDTSARQQQLKVEALLGEERIALPLALYLGDRPPKVLGLVRTRKDKPALLTIPTASLGPPGAKELSLRFSGDARYNAAQLRITSTLTTPVTITLRTERARVAADGRIVLVGGARDVLGPVKRAAISVEAMGRHVASATTADDGAFRVTLDAESFPPGLLDLRAVLSPNVSWRQPGRSPQVSVLIEPPRPIPLRLYATPAAMTALVLALLLGWRLRGHLRGDEGVETNEVEPLAGDDRPPPALRSGLTTAKNQRLRRQDFGLDGRVWDPVDGCPIIGATVALRDGEDRRVELESDAAGAFAVENLGAGPLALEVSCAGYVSERARLELPHRGNLRGLRIDLVPVRVRILELYRQVALDLLPKPRLWARWTPRDLLQHVRRADTTEPALEDLSALLERVYWSDAVAKEDDLHRARALAAVHPDRS
ncbi:MAG: hypothetical protein CSB49_07015 [Proteobacteria bacterium]|nr:MAG: hypothetical protein CSB49_07015 [Pseudomonadota bacterium]